MYHLLSGLYSQWNERPKYNVLLLGTKASGKTAWLDRVRAQVTGTGSRALARFTPTVGQNVVDLRLRYAVLHFWDLGGDESLRSIWNRYLHDADVLVWAMNARDWAAAIDVPAPSESEQEAQKAAGEDDETFDEASATRRRNESWGSLAELRKDAHVAGLPLLIVMTQIDRLTPSQADHFRRNVHAVIERKLPELALSPHTSQEEEAEGQNGSHEAWRDWKVMCCSAKTGESIQEFVDWLHSRAQQHKPRQESQEEKQ